MVVQPYMFFDGRCEEALTFYQKVLGAKVLMMMRYKESPEKNSGMIPPGSEEKVMHASFQVGETTLMASDGENKGKPRFEGMSLSLTTATKPEAERMFVGLSEGGQVQMPLTKTFFSDGFGMVADKFGMRWMIMVAK